jgi:hypothetical protein
MTMRNNAACLAILLLPATSVAAAVAAAPRAAAHGTRTSPDHPNERPAHHHDGHHGGGGGHHHLILRHPFSFDADFESDGSCEVSHEGDGRGTLRGSDSCEKNIRGSMRLECERGSSENGHDSAANESSHASGPARLTARSRAALGGVLSSRLAEHAGGDAPPGFLDTFVAAAVAEAPPGMLNDALLSEGGALTLDAKARFSVKCAPRRACVCSALPQL